MKEQNVKLENNIDILDRDSIVQGLEQILLVLSENREGKAFALDGKWGYGKSYILDMLERELQCVQNEETGDDRYFVFHYNCWQYDYYEEPAVAIVSAMLETINEQLENRAKGVADDAWSYAKNIVGEVAGEFVKNKIGVNPVEIYEQISNNGKKRAKATYDFDSMFAFKKTLDDTRKQIKKLSERQTVVLVVDELDRCMPQYAIKVLERLHHMFDGLNNVIVLMAIDSSQLEHSVKEIYGENVDTDRYLKKFISFSIELDRGKIQDSFSEKYSDYFSRFLNPKEGFNVIKPVIESSDLDIRNLEKVIEKVDLIHRMVCDKKVHSSVLAFEVIWTILRFKLTEARNRDTSTEGYVYNSYMDMQWLLGVNEINNKEYRELTMGVGTTIINHFRESLISVEEKKIIQMPGGTKVEVTNTVEGIMWYLFDQVLSHSKTLLYTGEVQTENLIKICDEFCNRAKVLL